jgi:hypothetical protein
LKRTVDALQEDDGLSKEVVSITSINKSNIIATNLISSHSVVDADIIRHLRGDMQI